MAPALRSPAGPCRGPRVPQPGRAAGLRAPEGAPPRAVVRGWDLVAGDHGPGTRYVLFTAGCPLRCLYCPTPQLWVDDIGRLVTVDDVLEAVVRYRPLFELTGGGITLSGGEPLLHAPFVAALAEATAGTGPHLALATTGIGGDRLDDAALAAIDLVLLDLKGFDTATFRRATNGAGGPALRFAERLAEAGTAARVKIVIVPGLTDEPANVAGLATFLGGLGIVEHVDVVPFDRAAHRHWADAGLDYPLAAHPGPTHDALDAVRTVLAEAGLSVA